MNLDALKDKWSAFGWSTQEIDGHDFNQIEDAIKAAKAQKGKPSMIILNTIKGKGCSFAEGKVGSHNMPISKEQLEEALLALKEVI
jgi:transketolase